MRSHSSRSPCSPRAPRAPRPIAPRRPRAPQRPPSRSEKQGSLVSGSWSFTSSLDPTTLGGGGRRDHSASRRVRREAAIPSLGDARLLDAAGAITDNFVLEQEAIALEVPHVETPQESLDRLRLEVEELRASRERLVLAADAERRRIERDLHDGPQQHLVALAANLQRARLLGDADPAAAKALLDEIGRDVTQALNETTKLAHRIYPPLLEAGGLRAALRAAAVSVGVATQIEAPAGGGYPPEVAGAVYFCCLDALERAGDGARATVTV